MTALYLNNFDVGQLGLKLQRLEGLGDASTARLTTAAAAGRSAQVVLASRATQQPRTITATLVCRPRSLAGVEDAVHKLYAIVGAGLIEIREGRDPEKVSYGLLEGAIDYAFDPQYVDGDPVSRITLRFTCHDPIRYSRSAWLIGFGAAPGNIPCGTAPCGPLLRIYGQPTSPFTITYRSMDGTARQVMGFTLTLGANDFLEIDCDAQTVVKNVAGSVSNAIDTWTTNTDGFIVLDPADADWSYAIDHVDAGRAWPMLELSSGFGLALYRKAYR